MKTKKHILVALIALNAICAQAVQYPRNEFRSEVYELFTVSQTASTKKGVFHLNKQLTENQTVRNAQCVEGRDFGVSGHFVVNYRGQIVPTLQQRRSLFVLMYAAQNESAMNTIDASAYKPFADASYDSEMQVMVELDDSTMMEEVFEDRDENGLYQVASRSPIRRASSGFPDNPYDYQTYTDGNGVKWTYVSGLGWISESSEQNQGDVNNDRMPIGSPVLPFLLFAMMACGVIYYRRRKLAIA